MATSDDRLRTVLERLEQQPSPDIASETELVRHEAVRFAARFGLQQPVFRPTVKLRFYGENVRDHALEANTGSRVVGAFVATVKAMAQALRIERDQAQLFLSPQVLPGSTILELVGDPRSEPGYSESLVGTIEDTATDQALSALFDTLDQVSEGPGTSEPEISPVVGGAMYGLAQELLDGGLDLDLTWTRPRGRSREVALARSRARHLRDILNRDTVKVSEETHRGQLVAVSTEGSITVRINGTPVTIRGTAGEEERLRHLWAHDVMVSWTETTHLHPQRNRTRTSREFRHIEAASDQPTLYDEGN